jgi:hypothetical protein
LRQHLHQHSKKVVMDVKQLTAAAEASMIALDGGEQAAKFYFQARAQATEAPVQLQILD